MPFQATCACGAVSTLDDWYAGHLTKCAACGRSFVSRPPADAKPPRSPPASAPRPAPSDPFERDRFLIKQKLLTVHEQYNVCDEHGQPLVSVKRPARIEDRLKANVLAGFAFVVVFVAAATIGDWFHDGRTRSNALFSAIILTGGVLGAIAGSIVYVYHIPLRATYFYTDSLQTRYFLEILQITRFALFHVRYKLRDTNRRELAVIERDYLRSLLRAHWTVRTPDGRRVICFAREDSVLLAILRRLLLGWLRYVGIPWVGPLTNFTIRSGTGAPIGTFNRKLTLLDRYVLDLSDDPQRTLDRRIALALGVLLDTGEAR